MDRTTVRTTLYSSLPASGQLATFIRAVESAHGRIVVVRPLAELPAPDVQHTQRLRRERGELVEAIAHAEASLRLLATGQLQPDAGRESGLRFDLEALKNRLAAVETVLGMEKTGGANG